MPKTYVLDTNVLIQAPYALESFEENHLVLPVAVLEELDKFKTEDGERGANTRQVIRFLEQLRQKGQLQEGIPLDTGGTLRLEVNHKDVLLPNGFDERSNDNRILKVCKGLMDDGHTTILVTRDIMVRIKAQMMGIPAEDFTTDQVPSAHSQYTGRHDVYTADNNMSSFKKQGIPASDLYTVDSEGNPIPVIPVMNQFFTIHSDTSSKKTLLGRFDGKSVVPLRYQNDNPFGVKPRNLGQYFLQEALMSDSKHAPLVIVKGTAGTAKTFYTLAVGLERIYNQSNPDYRRILVCRPNVQFDSEIGFLPGSEQEKIAPFLRPIIDNLEILVDKDDKERYRNEKELRGKIDELFDRGIITAEALNFIRGRSLTYTYLMIDEAQNLTPKQVKGIITRVGKGTKVILLGDPHQIDHPLLDERTNGLSYAAERMKGSPYCYQITMQPDECERSNLAFDAANRM